MSIGSHQQKKVCFFVCLFYVDEICTERHFCTVAIKDLKRVVPVINHSSLEKQEKAANGYFSKQRKIKW